MLVIDRPAPDTLTLGDQSPNNPYSSDQELIRLEESLLDQILTRLEQRRGQQTYSEFAREIGISRAMLRVMDLNGILPGMDSLSILLDWDSHLFTPIVVDYMHARGRLLRHR